MSYEDVYRRAGFPWYYPLVFILNIALIIALELMFIYQLSVPLTEETLFQQNPAYENATILRSLDNNIFDWYLVETDSSEYHVIPIRRHALFVNRCQICEDQIVAVPDDTAEMEITTKAGITSSTLLVGREVAPQYGGKLTGEMEIRPKWYGRSSAPTYAIGFYFLSGLGLSLLEYAAWNKLKR